jgi:hypothetical protein
VLLGILVFLHPTINVLLAVSNIALQSLRESYTELLDSTVTLAKLLQPIKALLLIDTTLSGIMMEVKPVQPAKALPLIDNTPLGIVKLVKPVHPLKAP